MSESLATRLREKIEAVKAAQPMRATGSVRDVVGLLLVSDGPPASLGDICEVAVADGVIRAQVVGFRSSRALLIPLDETEGLSPGARVVLRRDQSRAAVGDSLLGRVLDGFGEPLDGEPRPRATRRRSLYDPPPGPLAQEAIEEPLETGVRSIDALIPCGKGQRIGIFGGSGVGKSTLLGAMARHSAADVNVIALIGERNREVREFLEESLGERGRARSVVIAATSDQPAPLRVRAAFLAATVADYFRERGRDVLLIMDSVTRFAMAQREIGLAAGEPPSQKGYTPSVFQMLPKVFERGGRFAKGSVTGFYTVLVEGDDMNEPIADAARSLLDGHIVLSRELASQNHFPAIDVLESISRVSRRVASEDQMTHASRLRDALATYRRSEDLINLGAYAAGSNPKLDAVIKAREQLSAFLKQDLREGAPLPQTLERLKVMVDRI